MKTFITWMIVMCLVPLLSGCENLSDHTLTGHLWDGEADLDHSGPTPHPNLEIYQTSNHKDFLVLYDEVRANDGVIRRRAYLLNANQRRVEAGRHPRFIKVRNLDRLEAVPVETGSLVETNGTPDRGVRVLVQSDERHFTLFSDGREAGSFYLPAYVNKADRAWRVAVTPLAVTADVAIYSTIAAAIVGLAYLAAQASSNN